MERRGRNRRLNINDCIFQILMKSLDPVTELDQFERNLELGIMFHPNLSSYNIRFHFRIIISVNFNFNFSFSQFYFSQFQSISNVYSMISLQNQIHIE